MATIYATRADLQQLGLNASALQQIDTATQDVALSAASSLADSYLNARFALPLRSYGRDLTRAVVHIASYDLMVIRGYNPESGSDVVIKERAEAARAWLEKIAEGEIVPAVVDSSDLDAATGGGAAIVSTAEPRGWTDVVVYGDRDEDFWIH
jgi:phage gp36-like protein